MKEAIKEFLQRQEIENYQQLNKWLTDYLESAQIQKHIFLGKFDKGDLQDFQQLISLFKEGKHSELEQLFSFLPAEQTKKPNSYFEEWMKNPSKQSKSFDESWSTNLTLDPSEILFFTVEPFNNRNIRHKCQKERKQQIIKDIQSEIPEHLKQQLLSPEGIKHNQDKLEMSRLFEQFPNALKAIVECSTYGAKKYNEKDKWDNFRSVKGGSKAYMDALVRHLAEGWKNKDTESNLHHVAHIAWNSLAALELFLDSTCTDKK